MCPPSRKLNTFQKRRRSVIFASPVLPQPLRLLIPRLPLHKHEFTARSYRRMQLARIYISEPDDIIHRYVLAYHPLSHAYFGMEQLDGVGLPSSSSSSQSISTILMVTWPPLRSVRPAS